MPFSNGFTEKLHPPPKKQEKKPNFDIPTILLVQSGKQLTTIIHHPPKQSSISVLVLIRVYQISCAVGVNPSTHTHTPLYFQSIDAFQIFDPFTCFVFSSLTPLCH